MKPRPCQYCTRPMPWWYRLLGFWTCKGCVYRLSLGGAPMRPPEDPPAVPLEEQ